MKYSIMLNRDESWNMPQSHRHDCLELLLCLRDGGSFFLRDTVYPLQKGALLLLQENTLHRSIGTEAAYERYVVHIPRETLRAASGDRTDFAALFKENYYVQLEPEQFDRVRSLMEQCYAADGGLGEDVLQTCAFLSLLVFVARLLPASLTVPVFNHGLSPSVARAIDWINSHLEEDLSLDALAGRCYVTKYHLCRLFKEETGFTVGEYILQQRLLQAGALLRAGETVQRAAESAGFRNYNHFIRTFSRWMGVSPGRYRSQQKTE